jgi:hypothetical protein
MIVCVSTPTWAGTESPARDLRVRLREAHRRASSILRAYEVREGRGPARRFELFREGARVGVHASREGEEEVDQVWDGHGEASARGARDEVTRTFGGVAVADRARAIGLASAAVCRLRGVAEPEPLVLTVAFRIETGCRDGPVAFGLWLSVDPTPSWLRDGVTAREDAKGPPGTTAIRGDGFEGWVHREDGMPARWTVTDAASRTWELREVAPARTRAAWRKRVDEIEARREGSPARHRSDLVGARLVLLALGGVARTKYALDDPLGRRLMLDALFDAAWADPESLAAWRKDLRSAATPGSSSTADEILSRARVERVVFDRVRAELPRESNGSARDLAKDVAASARRSIRERVLLLWDDLRGRARLGTS